MPRAARCVKGLTRHNFNLPLLSFQPSRGSRDLKKSLKITRKINTGIIQGNTWNRLWGFILILGSNICAQHSIALWRRRGDIWDARPLSKEAKGDIKQGRQCRRRRNGLRSRTLSDTHGRMQHSNQSLSLYRARLKGGPQVAWMLQARLGKIGKEQQQ